MGAHSADDGTFRVLFVCTANQCRSPVAQRLFEHRLATVWGDERAAASWQIGSAGTHARAGVPMHPLSARTLTEVGVEPGAFASAELTQDLLRASDLVLTATRQHRATVVQTLPAVLGRTFTIRQFSYLLSAARPTPAPNAIQAGFRLIDAAKAARAEVPARTDADDLADPIGRPLATFRECTRSLRADVEQIVRSLQRSYPDSAAGS